MKLTLTKKFLLFFVLPISLIFFAQVSFMLIKGGSFVGETFRHELENTAQKYALEINTKLKLAEKVAQITATELSFIDELNEKDIYEMAVRNVNSDTLIFGSAIAFVPGYFENKNLFAPYAFRNGVKVETEDIAKQGYDYTEAKWDWYSKPIEIGSSVWSDPYFDKGAGNVKMVTYSIPVYKHGKLIAVTTVDIALEPLNELVKGRLSEFDSFGFIIVSATGQFIYHPSSERILRDNIFNLSNSGITPENQKEIGLRMVAGKSGTMRLYDQGEDIYRLAFFAPIKTTGWSISASLSERDAYASLNNLRDTIGITIIFSIIVLLIGTIIFFNKISTPIKKLRTIVDKVGNGIYEKVDESSGKDELSELLITFNKVTDDIKKREEELNRSVHDAGERVKELRCLYTVNQGAEKTFKPIENLLQITADAIPPGWQYPEITTARVTFDDMVCVSENFSESQWKQETDIVIQNEVRGKIEVFYLEEKRIIDFGPFMKEEQDLIQALARIIVSFFERKHSEEEIKISALRFKELIAASNTGAWEFDASTNFLWCSKEYFSMLGRDINDYDISAQPNLEDTWVNLLHPEDRERSSEHFAEYLKNGSVGTYENYFRMQHKDGSWIWIWSRGRTIRDEDGKPTDITIGTHIDITDQKIAEEELKSLNEGLELRVKERTGELEKQTEMLNTTIESLDHPFYVIDANDYSIVLANKAAKKLAKNDEITTCHALTHKTDLPCDSVFDPCPLKEMKITKQSVVTEHKHFDKDGLPYFAEVHGYPIFDENGEVVQMIEYSLDITDRKFAEAELLEAKNKTEAILEASTNGIITINEKGIVETFNPAAERIFGYSANEIIGNSINQIVPDEHAVKHDGYIRNYLNTGEKKVIGKKIENFGKHKSGKLIQLEIGISEVKLENAKLFTAIVNDITERKIAETALRKSQQQIATLVDSIQSVIFMKDREGRHILVNKSYEISTGITAEEIIGKTDLEVMPQNVAEKIMEIDTQVMNSGEILTYEEMVPNIKNESKYYLTTKVPLKDELGNVYGMCGVATDITNRKKLEEELRLIQYGIDNAKDSICFVDPDTAEIINANIKAYETLGLSKDELIGKKFWYFDINFMPENWSDFVEKLKSGEKAYYESVLCTKDDDLIPIEITASYFEFEGADYIVAFTHDITERKEAEQKIIKSKEAADKIVDTSSIPMAVINMSEAKFLRVNEAMCQFHKLEMEDLLNRNTLEAYVDPDKDSEVIKGILEKEGKVLNNELIGKRIGTGEHRISLVSINPITYMDNEAIVLSLLDITEMRKMQDELEKAKDAADKIVDAIPIPTAVTKLDDGTILRANKAMAEFHDVHMDKFKEMKSGEWYVNSDSRNDVLSILKRDGYIHNYEVKLKRITSGEQRDTIASFIPINYNGENCIVGSVIDITDRKKAEEQLKEKLEELERFNRLVVGRELIMIDLKKEVNDFLINIGREPKYKIVDEDDSIEEKLKSLKED